jgi:RNA polymerase sigma-70 factor, ECF subfamily
METDPPTLSLVRGAQSGDREQFAQLYERIAPAIYGWASLRLRSLPGRGLDPADVVQEVWCRALASLSGYDPAQTNFRGWIFTVARNVLLQALHKEGRGGGAGAGGAARFALLQEVPDDATAISQRVARDETLRTFVADVQKMSTDDQLLILLCGLEGQTFAEAAPRLGLTRDATAKRWQRLRARLEERRLPEQLLA